MEENKLLISDYVKTLRTKKGMTTEEMAAAYGVSRQAITRYEMGVYDNPSAKIASRFCKTFDFELLEFSENFKCNNKTIEKILELESQFKTIMKMEISDKSGRECVRSFFDQYKNEYKLSNFKPNNIYKDYENENINIYIPFEGECFNSRKEPIKLYRFLSAISLTKEPRNRSYRIMDQAISNVAAYSIEELGCNNYIFITNNRKMYNFFMERSFKKNDTNVMLVYTRDQKTFDEPEVLFGKNFLNIKK